MSEAIINTIESTPVTDNQQNNYTYTEQQQTAVTNKAPVVLCGWCGAVEQYIGNHKTICPNCGE